MPNSPLAKYADITTDANHSLKSISYVECPVSIPASVIGHVASRYVNKMEKFPCRLTNQPRGEETIITLAHDMARALALEAGFTEAGLLTLPYA